MRIFLIIAFFYIVIWNLAGFTAMGIDKRRAETNQWRVKEKTLFLIALLGGSAGSILGMRYYRHKTKHYRFVYGMPAILIIQLLLVIYSVYLA